MKASSAVLIIAAVACSTISSAYAARGVILTAPLVLERNAVNKLYLSLYDIDAAGTLDISLKSEYDGKLVAETVVDVEKGVQEKVVELKIPEDSAYAMTIIANGTFETADGYTFRDQDRVYSRSSPSSGVTFIQTDKPLYKPGQQVKFRVLPLDKMLKPLGKDVKGEVWIEDVGSTRIAQWKNVSLGEGIRQFEFPLSDEPPLGTWKILARIGNSVQTSHFDVKEYVLPKFEVTITPPSFVLTTAETIPIEICAKYTYGKDVQGTVKINSTLQSYGWGNEKLPVIQTEDQISGCYTFVLKVSLIDMEQYSYGHRRIEITAEVTENGTEITRGATKNIWRTSSPRELKFLQDHNSQYFKLGIPYENKVQITKPDGTAAPGEQIEICATVSRRRILKQWWATRDVMYCKNYTSNQEGAALFQVPPMTDIITLNLEAKATEYSNNLSGSRRLYQPRAHLTVKPFYSPSKSFIHVLNAGETLECGTSRNLQILYTAREGGNYVFNYQVIRNGVILQKGTKEVTFSTATDVVDRSSMCRKDLLVNEVEIPLAPSEADEGYVPTDDSECSYGLIGSIDVDIDVGFALSPSFQFLVYYIRDDGEAVVASSNFNAEKCLQHEVEFQFGDDEKQPGATTSLTLKASPNSFCGTKVVDKSITLMDSGNQLTKEKVFDALRRFDMPEYYYRSDHCNDVILKGDRIKPKTIGYKQFYSQHADALTAFEDTGFVVLSDLKFFTRPCSSYSERGIHAHGYASEVNVEYDASPQIVPLAMPVPEAGRSPGLAGAPAPPAPRVKSAAPSTKSVVDVRSFFPETWLFDMITLGESGELVSQVTLPHTITEWVGDAVCVNEAEGLGVSDQTRIKGFQAFFLGFTLPYSVIRGESVPLIISISNYLDKCLPISRRITVAVISDSGDVMSEKSSSSEVCVCGGKIDTFTYMFTPEYVGTLKLTVLGESLQDSSICGSQETAEVEARDMATKTLEVEAEGFPQEKVNSFMFCPSDNEESTYNTQLDLNVPDNFVEGSKRAYISLSGSIMGPALEGLDRLVRLPTGCGEQNMVLFTPNIVALDYLKSVGQLSETLQSKAIKNLQAGYQRELNYRHHDGSYSAFGSRDAEGSMWLSAFVLKSFSQARRYIDIDEGDISKTVEWILSKQQSDGCFPQVGRVFSYQLKGGLQSAGQKTAPLTAYVLSALITSNYRNETMINNALSCVKSDTTLTPYTAALYAYTAALAGHPQADRFLEHLSTKAITEGGEIYWRNIDGSKSLDVETAAYAVLAILSRKGLNGRQEALATIRHLTRMRNANGGFISTQDTVVGLEAIAAFASMFSQDPVHLTVKLNGGTLDETVTITQEDQLLVKKYRVPVVPSTVQATATGTGCGIIQATVRYNVLEVPTQPYFTISVNAARTRKCKKATINVCVRYVPENRRSNMALVEIKMVSGFAVINETLKELLSNTEVNLKRFEIDNNNVILYFDELSNSNTCFSFDVEEVIPVENSKPATAKVYDYYAKEKEESTDYVISGSC